MTKLKPGLTGFMVHDTLPNLDQEEEYEGALGLRSNIIPFTFQVSTVLSIRNGSRLTNSPYLLSQ